MWNVFPTINDIGLKNLPNFAEELEEKCQDREM